MKVYLAYINDNTIGGVFDTEEKAQLFLQDEFFNKYLFDTTKTISDLQQYKKNNIKEIHVQ